MIEIGNDIRVQAEEFKGKYYISIRRWYQDGEEWKPGRKGINFKEDEWAQFIEKFDAIKEDIVKAIEKE